MAKSCKKVFSECLRTRRQQVFTHLNTAYCACNIQTVHNPHGAHKLNSKHVGCVQQVALFYLRTGWTEKKKKDSLESSLFTVTVSLTFVCCRMWSALCPHQSAHSCPDEVWGNCFGSVNDSGNIIRQSKGAGSEHACVVLTLLSFNKCNHCQSNPTESFQCLVHIYGNKNGM